MAKMIKIEGDKFRKDLFQREKLLITIDKAMGLSKGHISKCCGQNQMNRINYIRICDKYRLDPAKYVSPETYLNEILSIVDKKENKISELPDVNDPYTSTKIVEEPEEDFMNPPVDPVTDIWEKINNYKPVNIKPLEPGMVQNEVLMNILAEQKKTNEMLAAVLGALGAFLR